MADRDGTLDLVRALDNVAMSRFSIVGSYARYGERIRQTLKDARFRIAAGCSQPGHKRENHLIWAAPGSGKTYFVEQIAASDPETRYCELNLAKLDEAGLRAGLEQVIATGGPRLCLVDEVDAKPDAVWPYELLLPVLDANLEGPGGLVFVLAGSSGSTMDEFRHRIELRPKGADLLSRIPRANEWVIAPMEAGDRILVAVSQMLNAAREAERSVGVVEKLALYYVASSPHLANARQLREFAVRAVERGSRDDDRVRYDDLFDSGDPENKRFWISVMPAAEELVNSFVFVEPQSGSAQSRQQKAEGETNLPVSPTPFIGRERELQELDELLSREDVRLLTLTGPGGTGKTRLAMQAAAVAAERYPDGVWWVPLAALQDPELVPAAIAATVGVREQPGELLLETLARVLETTNRLLVLDNFEHLLEAAPSVSALLSHCPALTLLVTSRAPLHLRGEREYLLAPLPIPEPTRLDPESLAGCDSVAFFCDRAQAVTPDFALSEQTAASVAGICTRLDGLPLALELAAARVKALSPGQILDRLEQSLPLLTGGARDLPERQQTLRATIEWSYDLLPEPEQRLFARLSVFAGGCTLDAAEQVADADLDTVQSLIDKSLLRHSDERYWMLQTIREYAAERLERGDETRMRHADWCLVLAEEAEPELTGAAQAAWLGRLDAEHDNLRAALAFVQRSGRSELEVRLAGALWRFWYLRGFLNEGQSRLGEILAAAGGVLGVEHEKILFGAAVLAHRLGDYDRAEQFAAERLAISRARGDPKLIASSLLCLGLMVDTKGDHKRALALYTECVDLARKQEDKVVLAMAIRNLAGLAREQGDDETARSRGTEALALFREISDTHGIAASLWNLGEVARMQGRIDEAKALWHEALGLAHGLGDKENIIWCLEGLGEQAASEGRADRAARLLGACDTLREDTGHAPQPYEQRKFERIMALLGAELDEEHLAAARAEGHAMTLDEAVAYALTDD